MTSSFFKSIRRTLFKNFGQFLAMIGILALGVALSTGLGATAPQMRATMHNHMTTLNVADAIASMPMGISDTAREQLYQNDAVDNFEEFFWRDDITQEAPLPVRVTRSFVLPLENREINLLQLLNGRYPTTPYEVLAEQTNNNMTQLNIGDALTVPFGVFEFETQKTVTVVGIVSNPLYFSHDREVAFMYPRRTVNFIIYFDEMLVAAPPPNAIFITAREGRQNNLFSSSYRAVINELVISLENLNGKTQLLYYYQNQSYRMLQENADRLSVISFVFPVFFGLVAALVVLSTMTRLVEKERGLIGCYKTLGYSNKKIYSRYLLFVILCCLLGSIIGFLAGFIAIPAIVMNVYNIMFIWPDIAHGFFYLFGLLTALILTIAMVGVTMWTARKSLKENCAALLQPKTPKAGKKILLERIGFIWKRLSFGIKSTMRNLFRYIKHLIMTVVSIAGCFALIFTGFGLFDSVTYYGIADIIAAMGYVMLMLTLAAGLLSVIVVYNLTNINIEERRREIATLKVLGYKNREVAGYIYREILALTLMGIAFGLPLGFGFLTFVLRFMIGPHFTVFVNWYSWFYAIGAILGFSVITAALLYRKIVGTKMSAINAV